MSRLRCKAYKLELGLLAFRISRFRLKTWGFRELGLVVLLLNLFFFVVFCACVSSCLWLEDAQPETAEVWGTAEHSSGFRV